MDVLVELRNLLEKRGWTEYRLAKECGLSNSTIANIFRRNTLPTIPTLEIICRNGFGITLAQFFAEDKMIELTPELEELFEAWKPLTLEEKELLLKIAHSYHKS